MTRTGRFVGIFLLVLGATCERSFGAAPEPDGLANPPDDVTWIGKRWSDGGDGNAFGEVPFLLDVDGVPRPDDCRPHDPSPSLPPSLVSSIGEAQAQIEALTPIRFRPLTQSPSYPFIFYTPDSDSRSVTRGMPTGSQATADCVFQKPVPDDADDELRLVLHETLHALGLAHEPQRRDGREHYVTGPHVVYHEKCLKDDTSPLKLYGTDDSTEMITPYDFDSVMQYTSSLYCDTTKDGCSADDPTDPNYPACTGPPDTCNQVCAHPLLLRDIDCEATKAATGTCSCYDPPVPGDCRWIYVNGELSVDDVNALSRMYEKPLDPETAGDAFGSAFAVGDFDSDGYDDLAVGSPGKGDGAVYLWKGTAGGRKGALGRLVAWRVLRPVTNTATRFGAALAAGDFDHDGNTDLAVGAPGDGPSGTYPGAVYIYRSIQATDTTHRRSIYPWVFRPPGQQPTALPTNVRMVTQASLAAGAGNGGDRFGQALTAGDFDGDGKDDLAIGVPRKKLTSGVRSGSVIVALNYFNRGITLLAGNFSEAKNTDGARFGATLADGILAPDDPRATRYLAVGSPGSESGTGAVYLFAAVRPVVAGPGAVSFAPDQILRPSDASASSVSGLSSLKVSGFGTDIAIDDFDGALTAGGHRQREIAIGAPGSSVTIGCAELSPKCRSKTVQNAGVVFVYVPQSGVVTYEYQHYDVQKPVLVQDPTPKANDQFGGVLMGFPSPPDANVTNNTLYAGVPARNRVYAFTWVGDFDHRVTVIQNGPYTFDAGDNFGAALAHGNFRPPANGDETSPENAQGKGEEELVVGAPGFNEQAGWLWSYNFDQESSNAFEQWHVLRKGYAQNE